MKQGDKVQVKQAYAGGYNGPHYAWFAGYELVSVVGSKAVVKHTDGLYEGLNVNYDAACVRPEVPSKRGIELCD